MTSSLPSCHSKQLEEKRLSGVFSYSGVFWCNEDDDQEDTKFCIAYGSETEEDDQNTGNHDNDDTQIAYKRDLEDFTRLWVYLKGVHHMVKDPNPMLVGLKFKDVTEGDPQIRLFEAYEQDGGVQYLEDENTANQQIQGQYGQAIESMFSANTVVNSQEPFIFPSEIWDELDEENYKKYFLFEGVSEGKGKLQIVFLNQNQEEIGEAPPIYLEITDIKKMYERYTLGENPDFEPSLFPSLVGEAYPPPEEDYEQDYVLFVHGYNMPSWEKDRWAETVFKRLWHQNYKGRVGILKWPCTTPGCVTIDGFDQSEFRAWQSGQGLEALINQLNGSYYGGRVRLLAHSQGNVVAGEALRRGGLGSAIVHTYVASQAAIPAHCYDDTTPSMPADIIYPFPTTPNIYGNYWQNGLAQHIPAVWPIDTPSYLHSDYMAGAAVNFVNYYNPLDYALSTNVWQTDQKLKPNNNYHYSIGDGFQFDSIVPFDERDLQFPDDRFEIFSFAAESRSFALGAQEGVGGVFTSEVNLNVEPFAYGNIHLFHSAQFRSFLANRWRYWDQLMLSFGFDD